MTMVRGRVMMLGVARGHGVMSLSLGQLPMLSHGDGHHWRSDQMSLGLSSTSLGRVYIGPLSVWHCALVSGLQLAHDWLMSCWGPHSAQDTPVVRSSAPPLALTPGRAFRSPLLQFPPVPDTGRCCHCPLVSTHNMSQLRKSSASSFPPCKKTLVYIDDIIIKLSISCIQNSCAVEVS